MRNWPNPIAACSAISATRSAITIGTSWFATAAGSSNAGRRSATISQDYEAALRRHYAQGAPPDWPQRFVSAYATSHPWEDFAETWAHYLHIVDTLETASAFGLRIKPPVDKDGAHSARLDFDPYVAGGVDEIVDAWAPFVVAMNSVNRAMGRPDLYPFVIAPAVVEKLRFIHELVRGASASDDAGVLAERLTAQAVGEAVEI